MKKLVLLAGAAASLTACSDETLLNDAVSQKVAKGITIEAEYPVSTVETRGALTEQRNFFWYAETDRISVWADGALVDPLGTPTPSAMTTPVEYKATVSAGNGQFTSVDDANMLGFVDGETPIDAIAAYKADLDSYETEDGDITSAKFEMDANDVQHVEFNELVAPMVAIKNNTLREKNYESVGEKVKFTFNRINPVLKLSSDKKNDYYFDAYLGMLGSITIAVDAVISDDDVADGFTFDQAVATDLAYTFNTEDGEYDVTSSLNEVIAAIKTPAIWNSDDFVNVEILPIKAEITDGAETKPALLTFTLTYEFENATLTKTITQKTPTDFVTEKDGLTNMVYTLPALDIEKDFPYIVTNTNDLLVFSGKFEDIYTDENQDAIDWPATNPVVGDIVSIYSKVVLTEDEQKNVPNFVNVVAVDLPSQTSIIKETFVGLEGQIVDLRLPSVTSYKGENPFTSLQFLSLGSYTFEVEGEEAATLFFNDDVKTTLEVCDIHSVTSLAPKFAFERNILFTDYDRLSHIYLNREKTTISANEFKGCTALEVVSGVVEMSTAANAFEDCSSLEMVNIYGTKIPSGAFKNSGVKDVLKGGKQVVPTSIGESAFEDNTAIEAMNLESVTNNNLGAYAFAGATSFVGSTEKNYINLNVTTVPEYAFDGTAVVRFQLLKATKTEAYSLNSAALKQIKYMSKTLTIDDDQVYTNKATTDIFVVDSALASKFVGYRTVTEEATSWTK